MTLEILSWDVAHGDAMYITTPNGMKIVRDLGIGSSDTSNATWSPLSHLKTNGVEKLDWVIVSHPHKDHIDDIMNFDSLSPRVFSRPKHLSNAEILKDVRQQDRYLFDKYFEINDRYTHPVIRPDPREPSDNGGVKILNFYPNPDSSNINDHSIVTTISYANSKVLIAGDNESTSWKKLLANNSFVQAIKDTDVFMASHHGRDSGYCAELFEIFEPKLTIVSDGRFGDTSATDRYSAVSKGWLVHHQDGRSSETRYCLTTRNDGFIQVALGRNNNNPFLAVTIQ